MSIWKYQYFVDVIDLKSFTKAGKKNYVSQTAISQQISQLEKSVGGKLINRGNGEITPTQMGKLVYERASEILRIDGQLMRVIEEMKASSVLRVGIDSSINKSFWGIMQSILDSYYEEEDFRFSKLDYITGSMMLDKNDLDIYISYGLDIKNENPNIREIPLCSTGYAFADSRFFSFCTGKMSFVEGITQVCSLKLFYRRDSMEKEKFLMDFIEKVREAVRNFE